MNALFKVVVGALTGWLTGKAVEGEGLARTANALRIVDIVCGIIGGVVGEKLFFWIIIGESSTFTDVAAAVLGAVTVTGLFRLFTTAARA